MTSKIITLEEAREMFPCDSHQEEFNGVIFRHPLENKTETKGEDNDSK